MLNSFSDMIQRTGMQASIAEPIAMITTLLVMLIIGAIAYGIGRKLLSGYLAAMISRSRTTWDNLLIDAGILRCLALLLPPICWRFAMPFTGLAEHNAAMRILVPLVNVYLTLTLLLLLNNIINAFLLGYERFEVSNRVPLKGVAQAVKVVVFFVGTILMLSFIFEKSPVFFLSSMGAMTAVLMLIFKDSILGFVAGIQLSALDMVRKGDWIEMPAYGADGDVVDITLTTVKVKNWDATITTVPTYALISGSFKNWRGMQETGGRRIARCINIDLSSIKFCDAEMLNRFAQIRYIKEYIAVKREQLAQHNQELHIDDNDLINARRLTNIGTFRAYITGYLRNHPRIHQNMIFLIRQLPPTEHGLPMQIYVFVNDIGWVNYEGVQADIFDHLLAIVPEFDLRVFQQPSGYDLRQLNLSSSTVTNAGTLNHAQLQTTRAR